MAGWGTFGVFVQPVMGDFVTLRKASGRIAQFRGSLLCHVGLFMAAYEACNR